MFKNKVYFICVIFFKLLVFTFGQPDDCNCTSVETCDTLSGIKKVVEGHAELYLKEHKYCGWNNENLQVCCSNQTHSIASQDMLNLCSSESWQRQLQETYLHKAIQEQPEPANKWPYTAALGYQNFNNPDKPIWNCGGSLISHRHVLTAAYCVDQQLYIIRLGAINLRNEIHDDFSKDYGIEKKIVHPNYNRQTFENDLAILKLDKDVEFTDNIKPVCLPKQAVNFDFNFFKPKVLSWGSTSESENLSEVLLNFELEVYPNNHCEVSYDSLYPNRKFDNRTLCIHSREKTDPCYGNSGSPLVLIEAYHTDLIGIVSYGYKCANSKFPGVYTRVNAFMDFILKEIED